MNGNTLARLCLAALLALFVCVTARAQTDDGLPDPGDAGTGGRHTIQGRVYLPSGRRLDRRLRVRLSGTRGGDNTTYTDDNGAFVFRRLVVGTYTVTVEGGREFGGASETVDILEGSRQDEQVYTVQIRLAEKDGGTSEPRAGVVSAAAASAPEAARARYEKALEAAAGGDHRRAVKELKAALEIHPPYTLALNELGAEYVSLGRLDDAAKAFDAAVKLAPDEPVLRVNYGILLIRRRQYAEAEQHLARAVALDEKNAAAHLQRGHALIRLGRGGEAETELRLALKLGGAQAALAHRFLGALYVERGDDARAAAELEEYLRLTPGAPDAAQVRAVLTGLKPSKK
ncbi:MAG TPA: tetratricopeptide repeat protein [Pyrinomonadaceae bacterium]|nr:tetratricopeptide repeat protein [Pyrinomonadaceae bacterium]